VPNGCCWTGLADCANAASATVNVSRMWEATRLGIMAEVYYVRVRGTHPTNTALGGSLPFNLTTAVEDDLESGDSGWYHRGRYERHFQV
jgi:hypothetical protein